MHKKSGRVFVQDYYSETILSAERLFPDTLFTSFDGCCGCCPYGGNILYFLGSEAVKGLYITDQQNLAAACNFTPMGLEESLYAERRVVPGSKGRLLVFRKLPDCELPPEQDQSVLDEVFRIEDVLEFLHDRLAIVDFDGNELQSEEFRDRGIPDAQRALWEQGEAVESIRQSLP